MEPLVEATIYGAFIIGGLGLVGVVILLFGSYWLKKRFVVWDEKRKRAEKLAAEIANSL